MKRWYQNGKVQAAIVTGVFAVIVTLIGLNRRPSEPPSPSPGPIMDAHAPKDTLGQVPSLMSKAITNRIQGEYDTAEKDFLELIDRTPSPSSLSSQLENELGIVYWLKWKKTREATLPGLAKLRFENAIRHRPESYPPRRNLAFLMYDTEQYSQAKTMLKQLLDVKPEDGSVHNELGLVMVALGKQAPTSSRQRVYFDEAEQEFNWCIDNRFSLEWSHYNLACLKTLSFNGDEVDSTTFDVVAGLLEKGVAVAGENWSQMMAYIGRFGPESDRDLARFRKHSGFDAWYARLRARPVAPRTG